jgi:predicted RecA/RadA family phage recombinase
MAITGIQLRSSKWRALTYTVAGSAVTAGAMTKLNDTVGVYFESKSVGEDVAFVYEAEKILLPKAAGSGLTIAQGAKVYFDNSAKTITPTSGGNTLCGRCVVAADADDTTVLVDFNGACAA